MFKKASLFSLNLNAIYKSLLMYITAETQFSLPAIYLSRLMRINYLQNVRY